MFEKEKEEFKGTISRQVDFVNKTTVGPLWIAVFILYKNWRSYTILGFHSREKAEIKMETF